MACRVCRACRARVVRTLMLVHSEQTGLARVKDDREVRRDALRLKQGVGSRERGVPAQLHLHRRRQPSQLVVRLPLA